MKDRKRQVLLTAQRLFIEKGFISTSVQDILDESNISKGTFYNYFPSKNDCLIAILERGRDETILRRRELLIGEDISNKAILAEQISIRQQVNRDHNLLPIFEAIFHSGDPELSAFAKKHHYAELHWLANRLIDVYGTSARPYASDCAVLLVGMMHHMLQVCSVDTKKEMNPITLVNYAMRRIDSMMPTIIETKDRLLMDELDIATNSKNQIGHTKEQLLKQLSEFYTMVELDINANKKEFLDFLIKEINSQSPRIYVLETITRSFREAFANTPYDFKSEELALIIWKYLDILKEK